MGFWLLQFHNLLGLRWPLKDHPLALKVIMGVLEGGCSDIRMPHSTSLMGVSDAQLYAYPHSPPEVPCRVPVYLVEELVNILRCLKFGVFVPPAVPVGAIKACFPVLSSCLICATCSDVHSVSSTLANKSRNTVPVFCSFPVKTYNFSSVLTIVSCRKTKMATSKASSTEKDESDNYYASSSSIGNPTVSWIRV